MDMNTINGILRAIVPAVVAYLVGKGYPPQMIATDVSAAILALAAAGWSVKTNHPALNQDKTQ